MRFVFVSVAAALLFSCSGSPENKSGIAPPEIVQAEEVHFVGDDTKMVTVGNSHGSYSLACRLSAALDSCVTPAPGSDYYVFKKDTRWKFPGGEKEVTLAFFEDFSISYNDAENVALVPVSKSGTKFGMYWVRSWAKK